MEPATTKEQKPEFVSVASRVHSIECSKAFSQLNAKERAYAYYFTRASWEGAKICYFQRSYEAPAFFYLFQKIFISQSIAELKTLATGDALKFSDAEWTQLIVYIAAFFQNCGNYKSFGDTKFVPEVSKEKFVAWIRATKAYSLESARFEEILDSALLEIYEHRPPYYEIAFSDNGGASSYYSYNISSEDAEFVKQFLQEINISPLNTRVIKINPKYYNILFCSQQSVVKKFDYKGVTIELIYGDFAPFMTKVVENLKLCGNFAANEHQKNMIQKYVEHFESGDVNLHKDSQRHWIKDKGPVVETNIGFIEVYLDPAKVRAEFEGFVAAVDKEATKKLSDLVANAETLIANLTWPKEFEIDTFSKPDFTSLEVITFACSGTPIGINLPNYDDITKNEGFKNVNLGNAYGKPKKEYIQYVDPAEIDLFVKYSNDALFLIVALHELLGHGTGKLFVKDKDGKYNFDQENLKHPLTGEKITNCYNHNETWGSRFGELASGYEECRADGVALYLSCFDKAMEILFPGREAEWDDIRYIGWYEIIIGGIKGLSHYIKDSKKWGQAHVLASYALLQVCIQAGNGFVTIKETTKDGKPYLVATLDKSQITTTGKKAVGDFLRVTNYHNLFGLLCLSWASFSFL